MTDDDIVFNSVLFANDRAPVKCNLRGFIGANSDRAFIFYHRLIYVGTHRKKNNWLVTTN